MYRENKILCIIPARSGSKSLPNKNIKELLGKPLIAYTIEQSKRSKYIDRTIVSTEDLEIAAISKRYGAEVPFIRPACLARDESGAMEVLLHSINWVEDTEDFLYDIVVLLHATAPLRNARDIDNCVEMLVEKNAENIFSVTEAHRNPYFNMVEISKDMAVRLVKEGIYSTRQAAPKVYDMNASIYVWWRNVLREQKGLFLDRTYAYVMPKERSVDIDDFIDFKIAEMFLKEGLTYDSCDA